MLYAIIHFGHLLGVLVAIGGLVMLHYAVLPAAGELPDDARARLVLRTRARLRMLVHASVGLIVITGLLKWAPASWGTGGIGWTGAGGAYAGLLHVKILLGLIALAIVSMAARPTLDLQVAARRTRSTKMALHIGLVVILLGVLHSTRALGI